MNVVAEQNTVSGGARLVTDIRSGELRKTILLNSPMRDQIEFELQALSRYGSYLYTAQYSMLAALLRELKYVG